MSTTLKWHAFNAIRGMPLGLRILATHLGRARALRMALRMQWRLLREPPFRALNAAKPPTNKERMSQQQLAPLVVLYSLLRDDGMSEAGTLKVLADLSEGVGIGFMQVAIPVMTRDEFRQLNPQGKQRLLARNEALFFNAEGTSSLDDDDNVRIDVHRCHFAHYSKAVGLPQLGPMFCAVDKPYFERHQPDVVFFRSRTLAEDQLPCDFHFHWRS